MAQTTGRATIKVNGAPILSREGSSINFGGPIRTAVVSDQGDVDFSETVEPSTIVINGIHRNDIDIISFRQLRDVTLSFEADTGTTWAVEGAFCANVGELSNGEYTVTFNGPPANRTNA